MLMTYQLYQISKILPRLVHDSIAVDGTRKRNRIELLDTISQADIGLVKTALLLTREYAHNVNPIYRAAKQKTESDIIFSHPSVVDADTINETWRDASEENDGDVRQAMQRKLGTIIAKRFKLVDTQTVTALTVTSIMDEHYGVRSEARGNLFLAIQQKPDFAHAAHEVLCEARHHSEDYVREAIQENYYGMASVPVYLSHETVAPEMITPALFDESPRVKRAAQNGIFEYIYAKPESAPTFSACLSDAKPVTNEQRRAHRNTTESCRAALTQLSNTLFPTG